MSFFKRDKTKDKVNKNIVNELARHVLDETLSHEGGNDPNWAPQQVMLIAKHLHKAKDLEKLLKVVIDKQEISPCISADIKTSMGSDIYYYVVKLFRYHFARTNIKLVSSKNCQIPPGKSSNEVCVNPLHYSLPKSLVTIPPVRVDTDEIQQGPVPQRIMDHCYQTLGNMKAFGPPSTYVQGDELADHINNIISGIPPKPSGTDLFLPDNTASTANQILTEAPASGYPESLSPNVTSPENYGSPNSYMTNDDRDNESPEAMDTTQVEIRRLRDAIPSELQASLINPARKVKTDVEFNEPTHWVSITYYERSKRVGAPVDCRSPYVLVDGFTGPYNSTRSRVSLGYFTNPIRDVGVSRALLYIGRGARLYNLGGEVFIECLSAAPIFVQSPNCNQRHGWHAASVVQVPPGCNLKIFSYAELSAQLTECVRYGFDAVYALARLCTIRVSFVKGWGSAFRRQQVTATPCWVECHLNGALEWIDSVLVNMGCPSRVCTSFS